MRGCAECEAPAAGGLAFGRKADQSMIYPPPVPCRETAAGVVEASVLMATVESKVAACPGVKVRQTVRLAPGASAPGPPPEMIWKPATRLQSTYVGEVLLEQL